MALDRSNGLMAQAALEIFVADFPALVVVLPSGCEIGLALPFVVFYKILDL